MPEIPEKKMSFLAKVSLLFVLLGLGYYKNHHPGPEEKIFSQKPRNSSENTLILPGNPPSVEEYRIVKIEFKK